MPKMKAAMAAVLVMEKEGIHSDKGLRKLQAYFFFWSVFLVYMTLSLLFGVHRGLVFYDFAYELNFLLAFSGIFYIWAVSSRER